VLHTDEVFYISFSVHTTQLYEHFGKGKAPESLGRGRDWNVDLIPKFLMANGMCMWVYLLVVYIYHLAAFLCCIFVLQWVFDVPALILPHQKGK